METNQVANKVNRQKSINKHNSKSSNNGNITHQVSSYAYKLVCFEMVKYCDERNECEKLERMGFQIGYKFAERFVINHQKFGVTLDVIKFMCKDLWTALFGKNVDKLQTNHKGIYVLHDNTFSWINEIDIDYDDQNSINETKKYLIAPCGLIRGALTNLGIKCVVKAEFYNLPTCLFNIQILEDMLVQ